MDYAHYRNVAKTMIPKYGTTGMLKQVRAVTPNPAQAWKVTQLESTLPINLVSFPDDGVTFVDHNITGNVRILLVAPSDLLTSLEIGDTITYGAHTCKVQKYKTIDPDGTGAILWAILVV